MIRDTLRLIRKETRALEFVSRMIAYMIETSVSTALMKNEWIKRKHLAEKVNRGSRAAMRSLGFEVTTFGYDPKIHGTDNFLVVANHLSYLDVFLMAAELPTLFVTSVDMGEKPILGHVCRIAGCIFVERRNRTTIEKDIEQMTEALKNGLNVTIFPEATSSDGADVLPFKKSLLMSSVFAGKSILPIAIKYTEIDGEPFTRANHDKICWYRDDQPFTDHFLKLMRGKNVKVEIHFLPIIKTSPTSTRDELQAQAYKTVRDCYMGLDGSAAAPRAQASAAPRV